MDTTRINFVPQQQQHRRLESTTIETTATTHFCEHSNALAFKIEAAKVICLLLL